MTFSDSAVTDVVVDTSGETASYGAAAAEELKNQLLNAGSDEIDGVSGSTITSDAVKKAAKSCFAQAKGEATVTSVQLPTGDETDWLGKEPDIDEAAITETVDTDILIVGAGNGGMFAAAYAAAKGLNFRVIEQNGNVQDTRHWVGAVDGFGAQEQGIKMDRAKLLSEVSRYASGKCDQRVVKTWINESAEMIEFVRSIMEDKYGVKMIYTYGDEAKWPAENAEHNTDYMYPEIEYTYDRSSGAARNELLLQYIQELGYDVDFKTSLAKLEKNSDGRITGIIAQSTEDDHFIRYNANKGVLLACGGFPGNPYMMEQLVIRWEPPSPPHAPTLPPIRATASGLQCGPVPIWTRRPLPCCLTAASWPPAWMAAMWTATLPLAARHSRVPSVSTTPAPSPS